jgi:hypothetical protein
MFTHVASLSELRIVGHLGIKAPNQRVFKYFFFKDGGYRYKFFGLIVVISQIGKKFFISGLLITHRLILNIFLF